MVSPAFTRKLAPSKFHTPPMSLANAVSTLEAKVVAFMEFPVASVIVLVFPLMDPVATTVMDAAAAAAMEAAMASTRAPPASQCQRARWPVKEEVGRGAVVTEFVIGFWGLDLCQKLT